MDSTTAPVICDTLIVDGFILTLDSDSRVFKQGAIAIKDDRIVSLGAQSDLASHYKATQTIQAKGGIVMPGLVNSHNHTPLMIVRGMVEDLNFAPAYTPSIPQGHKLSTEECYLLSRLGVYELLRFGSTTVVDYYRHPNGCALAIAEAGIRGFIGGRIHDADPEQLSQGRWHYDSAIGEQTLQETLELIDCWQGQANGRIQCILAPHAPDTCSKDLWKQVVDLSAQFPYGIHTHLSQSQAEVERVKAQTGHSPVELLDELGLLNDRLIAAHCIWLSASEVVKIGKAGVCVAHVPVGNATSGTIAPAYDLAHAGATLTLATDTKSGDMFEAMRMAIAVARIRGAGYDFKATTALQWATINGAKALGISSEIGSLEVGKKADIVLLNSAAPNLCPVVDGAGIVVHSGMGANVNTVLVDGRIVLEDGQPTQFDGTEVVAAAQQVATRLWTLD